MAHRTIVRLVAGGQHADAIAQLRAVVRTQPDLAAVPVVMFSACQDAETVSRALESGAIDFWRKASFNFNELPERVRTLMNQRPA
jgi:DNA-binding response OmpR family regulator